VEVEFLFWADCPSHGAALERLKKVLEMSHWNGEVRVIEVRSEDEARRLGFIGSPTIRFNGLDIDPEGLEGEPPGLTCRIYRLEDGRISPLPSEVMIRRALERADGGAAAAG